MKPVAYVTTSHGPRSGYVSIFGSELRAEDLEAARAAALDRLGAWGARNLEGIYVQQPASEPGAARVGGGALRDRLKVRVRGAQAAAEELLRARGYTTRRHA